MFAENNASEINLTPYVYVRDVETLYAETACASGSIVVASILGKNVTLRQPSGETLHVAMRRTGDFGSFGESGRLRAS